MFCKLAFLYSKIQASKEFSFFCQEKSWIWRRIIGKEAIEFQESGTVLRGWWPRNDFLTGYGVFSPYTQETQPGRLLQALDKCRPHEIQARQGSVSKHIIQRRKKKAVPHSPIGRLWIGDPHTRRGLLMITYASTVQEHTSLGFGWSQRELLLYYVSWHCLPFRETSQ